MAIRGTRINTRSVRRKLDNVYGKNPFDNIRQLNKGLESVLGRIKDFRNIIEGIPTLDDLKNMFDASSIRNQLLDVIGLTIFGKSFSYMRGELKSLLNNLGLKPYAELARLLGQSSHLIKAIGYEISMLIRHPNGELGSYSSNYDAYFPMEDIPPGSFNSDPWLLVGNTLPSLTYTDETGTHLNPLADVSYTNTNSGLSGIDVPTFLTVVPAIIHLLPYNPTTLDNLFNVLSDPLGNMIASMVTSIGLQQQDLQTIYTGLVYGDVQSQLTNHPTLVNDIINIAPTPSAALPLLQHIDVEAPTWYEQIGLSLDKPYILNETWLATLIAMLPVSDVNDGTVENYPPLLTGSQILVALATPEPPVRMIPFMTPMSLYETFTNIDV